MKFENWDFNVGKIFEEVQDDEWVILMMVPQNGEPFVTIGKHKDKQWQLGKSLADCGKVSVVAYQRLPEPFDKDLIEYYCDCNIRWATSAYKKPVEETPAPVKENGQQ